MHELKTINLIIKHVHRHLTCITVCPSPSRFTRGTHSTLYVTRAVFTVGWTRCVTVTAEETDILTA